MKKLIVIFCVMCLLVTSILPAMAEQSGGSQGQPPQMGQGGPKGPGDNQTPPEKPEGDQQPGGKNPPSRPGDSSSSGGQDGSQPGNAPEDSLKKLVESGTLSQTTYDAIREYMKNNAPSAADSRTPPEKPEGDGTQQAPEKPDGDKAPAGQPGMLNQDMLKALLDAGVITEDEYNTLLESISADDSAENETEETTETND